MKSLQNLLAKRENKKSVALTDKDIFFIFNRIIKQEFGNVGENRLKPDFYKAGTIFVRSTNSAWASELFSNRNTIIKKINKELGEKIILEIKLK